MAKPTFARITKADTTADHAALLSDLMAVRDRAGCEVCGALTGMIYGPPREPRHRRLCGLHRPAWAAELDARFRPAMMLECGA